MKCIITPISEERASLRIISQLDLGLISSLRFLLLAVPSERSGGVHGFLSLTCETSPFPDKVVQTDKTCSLGQ